MSFDATAFRDKTALVTGASDGIGLEIARGLAVAGARVFMPVRNKEKGDRATAQILNTYPDARLELLDLDLAQLDTVNALASTLNEKGDPINLLMLNAGVVQLGERRRSITADGFELAFQTNFLGHFALTKQLLPLLRAGRARVAVQCSLAASGASVRWGDLRGENHYDPFIAYRSSKAALGLFGIELARRSATAGWGITVELCHPGISPGSAIAPELRALLPEKLVHWAVEHVGNPPREAARTALAALAAEAGQGQDPHPRMFVPSGLGEIAGPPRERAPFRSLDRPGDARVLWELAERWTQLTAA